MDSPKRYEGYTIVIFIFFFLYSLFGFYKVNVQPADMAVIGQFGDMFGAFNAGLGMLTVWLAFRNLSLINDQIKAQQDLALEQKKNEIENMLREKLERTMFAFRYYVELCRTQAPQDYNKITPSWAHTYNTNRIMALKEPEALYQLYFPCLKSHFSAFMEANNGITTAAVTVSKNHNQDTRYNYAMALRSVNETYKVFHTYLINNTEKIIKSSPAYPK